jgi:hypothetical protein
MPGKIKDVLTTQKNQKLLFDVQTVKRQSCRIAFANLADTMAVEKS